MNEFTILALLGSLASIISFILAYLKLKKTRIWPFHSVRDVPKINDSSIKSMQKANKYDYDVFLSYSYIDRDIAKQIREQLSLAGLNCFMAFQDIESGDDWADSIRNALINSREMCVVFTLNSKKSEWIRTELAAAWVLKKKIVPILIGISIDELPKIPEELQALHFQNLDTYLNEVKLRHKVAEATPK